MVQWRYPVAVLASIGVLSACGQRKETQPAEIVDAPTASPAAPVVQLPEPALDRERVLLAALHAASDFALGKPDENDHALDGKRFKLHFRFGCVGDERDQFGSWAFDEKRRLLSLRVEPGITDSTALPQVADNDDPEAVEGFWIHRPWIFTAGCPAIREPTSAAPDNEQSHPANEAKSPAPFPSIGIAQFFSDADARTHRRGNRDYTATKILAEGVSPSRAGYDLVIAGRLKRQTNGLVVHCANSGAAGPPSCIISAQFDSVSIEEPATGEVLATWSNG